MQDKGLPPEYPQIVGSADNNKKKGVEKRVEKIGFRLIVSGKKRKSLDITRNGEWKTLKEK